MQGKTTECPERNFKICIMVCCDWPRCKARLLVLYSGMDYPIIPRLSVIGEAEHLSSVVTDHVKATPTIKVMRKRELMFTFFDSGSNFRETR